MSELLLTDAYEIAAYIKAAEKQTPIKLYIKGDFENPAYEGLKFFGSGDSYTVFGDASAIYPFLEANKDKIKDQVMEYDRRNSAIPLLDTTKIDARIEPGSFIRDHVTIGKSAVIMMGAVINIGAVIGEGTMIDMGAVVGARGTIGKNCHIGAGAVVAGVLEPPSKSPVIIEDGVLVGANAVIIEGVHIGEGAVVAAGAIVLEDVPANAVVAGSPAKIVKMKDEKTEGKTALVDLLLRTYNVPDGTLFVDGRDVNSLSIHSVRNACAYVPQDNFLFSDTLKSNIAFGAENDDMEAIQSSAERIADMIRQRIPGVC